MALEPKELHNQLAGFRSSYGRVGWHREMSGFPCPLNLCSLGMR